MKKVISKTVKFLTLFFVLIFALLITVPLLFKDKISAKVEQTINQYVNAKVEIDNYKLSLFRNFPNISLSLDKVSVSGIGKFENDTLVQLKSINIVFNLSSLFKKTGYEIKSVEFDGTDLNAIVLEDGTANWDIMKETQEETFEEDSPSDMKILLKKVSVLNSSISYIDRNSSMEASLDKLNLFLKGDLTMNETNLNISMNVGEVSFMMEGMKYLNKAIFESIVNLSAKLDSMVFYLEENYLMVNDLKLNFAGMFAMPDDNIETDLTFNTEKTSFKTLLSLIPAIYMKDYDELKTSGEFSLRGTAKGIYSDADSTLPDITLDLVVNNGLISYPSLPEQIRNINISSNLFMAGTDMDRTVVNINKFHMELAGNPFDMTFSIKTPVSDPDISGTMKGRIDLNALSEAVPLDSIDLSGTLDMSLSIAGRLSMIEKEQFDRFKALGNISAKDILVAVTEYPEVKIIQAGMEITPAYTDLKNAQIRIGQRSDFLLNGKLENYIPYLFAEDVIRGFLNLRSKSVDLDEIMEGMVSDTTIADTTSLTVIKIPENIYFDFNASIDQLKYNKILVNNVKGQLVIKDGTLSVSDAGMDLLGGKIVLDAGYDTRDTLSPVITADLNVESLGVKDAYSTFNTIRRLAPFSKGIDGSLSMRFSYKSLLSRNLMPVIHTISGNGKIMSDEITLVESVSYDNIKEVLKLGDKYSNTFKDLNISFKINDGRVYVSPFNAKTGNIKMNIEGDQGLDQTLNYLIKTEIPRSELGTKVNSLIDNLSSKAADLGIKYETSDILKVNLKISGTFLKPVVTPFFGDDLSQESSEKATDVVIKAARSKIDTTVVKAKETAKKEVEIQADRLVQEAEEKAQQIRDEAAQAAEKIRHESENQAQRLIREADNRGAIAKLSAQKAAEAIRKEADKRAQQLITEADEKANKIVEEAKTKREEILKE